MKKINKFDLILFFGMSFILSIWLIIFYPGILSFDSYNQLGQITSMTFTTGHPFVHTFIELICLKMWNSPASIAVFQIFVFAVTWVSICKYNRKHESKKERIIQAIITLIICLNPIIGTYTITLWKDILYSIIILQISFVLEIFIDKKFKVNNKNIIVLSFLLIMVKNIRYNGAIITLFISLIVAFLLFIYDRKKYKYLILIASLIIFNYGVNIPSQFFKIDYGDTTTSKTTAVFTSKFIQAFGSYVTENNFDNQELNELDKYVNIEELKEKYNPYFMDPIGKVTIDNQKINNNFKDFTFFLIKSTFKYPKTTIRFWAKSTVVLWKITKQPDSIGTAINTNIIAENKIDTINHLNSKTWIYQTTNRVLKSITSSLVLNTILCSPALYLYLSIILAIYLFIKINKHLIWIIIPNLLSVGGLIISIPVQDVRYVYANFLIFFLTLVIFIDKKNSHMEV